jgi:hypothetical protein
MHGIKVLTRILKLISMGIFILNQATSVSAAPMLHSAVSRVGMSSFPHRQRSQLQDSVAQMSILNYSAVVGQTIDVPVQIQTSAPSRGAQLSLAFDPAILHCDSVDEANFYGDWANAHNGSTSIVPNPSCNNTQGKIATFSIFILGGDAGGPTGQGAVFILHFTVKANGVSPLALSNVVVSDDNSARAGKLTTTVTSGQVVVGPTPIASAVPSPTATLTATPAPSPTNTATLFVTATTGTPQPLGSCAVADVNADGVVDVLDQALIGSVWMEVGTPGWIPEDIYPDGIIDVFDMSTVGACMNTTGLPAPTSTPTFPGGASATATGTANATNPPQTLPPSTRTPTPSPTATSTGSGGGNTVTPTSTTTPSASATLPGSAAGSVTPTITPTPSPTPGVDNTFTPTPSPEPKAFLWIEGPTEAVAIGQSFDVTIMVKSMADSRGAQTGLVFDPTVLKCTKASEGAFYKAWSDQHNASTQLFPSPSINNTTGKMGISSIIILGGDAGGATGQGSLFVLKFTALKAGSSALTLDTPKVSDSNSDAAKALPLQLTNGSIQVSDTVAASSTPTPTLTATRTLTQSPMNTPSATVFSAAPTNTSTTGPTATPTLTRTSTQAGVPTSTATSPTSTMAPMVALPTTASNAHLSFSPPQALVSAASQEFTVNVVVNTDKPTRSFQAKIKFDPSILKLDSLEEGDFYSTWAGNNGGSSNMMPAPTINNTLGETSVIGILITGAAAAGDHYGGPTGSGTIIVLHFTSKAVGVSTLTMENVLLGDDSNTSTLKMRKLQVAVDGGEAFVGVTPTPTQPGGSGTQSASATATTGSGGTPSGSRTPTPFPGQPTVGGTISGSQAAGPAASNGTSSGSATPAPTAGIQQEAGAKQIQAQAPATGGKPGEALASISEQTNSSGVIQEKVEIQSPDGLVAIRIPVGVQALTADHRPLRSISFLPLGASPAPAGAGQTLIGLPYELGPSGAIFNPPATIVLAYNKAQLPKGADEHNLALAYFDPVHHNWIVLKSQADPKTGTVSAQISHFSVYTIVRVPGTSPWAWIGSITLSLLMAGALAAYLLLRRRKQVSFQPAWGQVLLLNPPENSITVDPVVPALIVSGQENDETRRPSADENPKLEPSKGD